MRTEADIYKTALALWGEKAQLLMFVEESSELNHAICAYLRNRDGAREGIIEEMADCQIILDQMKEIFSREAFEEKKQKKLARLDERLMRYERYRREEQNQ